MVAKAKGAGQPEGLVTVRTAGRALLGMGFEPDAARFLAVVLLAGGVFTEGIVARWVGDEWGTGRTQHFFDGLCRLWKERFPRDTGIVSRAVAGGSVYHCMGKALYREIGRENSKFRRGFDPTDAAEVFRRVVRVAAVLRWCRWPWVLSGAAQLAAVEAVGLSRSVCPSRAYGKGAGAKRQVFFYDRPALVIQSDRCVLLHPFVEESPGGALVALQGWWRHYSGLVRALGEQGIQVSLRIARSGEGQGGLAVAEQAGLWEADGSTVEAIRSIWVAREELRRLDGAHPAVVRVYGGEAGVAARRAVLEARVDARRGDVGGGVVDAEVWDVEGVPT